MRTTISRRISICPLSVLRKIRNGLAVDLLDNTGAVLTHSTIDFVSPQVDNGLQSDAGQGAHSQASSHLRNGQLVNARVTWSTDQTADGSGAGRGPHRRPVVRLRRRSQSQGRIPRPTRPLSISASRSAMSTPSSRGSRRAIASSSPEFSFCRKASPFSRCRRSRQPPHPANRRSHFQTLRLAVPCFPAVLYERSTPWSNFSSAAPFSPRSARC